MKHATNWNDQKGVHVSGQEPVASRGSRVLTQPEWKAGKVHGGMHLVPIIRSHLRVGWHGRIDHTDVLRVTVDGIVHNPGISRTRRDPNRQNNGTAEYDIGKQMECRTYCCYEQAEEGNTQRRTGSRPQESEHADRLCSG